MIRISAGYAKRAAPRGAHRVPTRRRRRRRPSLVGLSSMAAPTSGTAGATPAMLGIFLLQMPRLALAAQVVMRCGRRLHSCCGDAGKGRHRMTDYTIGYGKPPRASRYKPGTSGNPRGRPKRQSLSLADIIDHVLGARITYREQGRVASSNEASQSASLNHCCTSSMLKTGLPLIVGPSYSFLRLFIETVSQRAH